MWRVAAILVIAACSSSKQPQSARDGGAPQRIDASASAVDAIDQFSAYVDKMCACQDQKCLKTVDDELNHWAAQQTVKPTAEQMPRVNEITKRMSGCMTRVLKTVPDAG
jgi:hypothetical protein